jgi:hypothetical protein
VPAAGELWWFGALALVAVAPMAPGAIELWRVRDRGRLEIDRAYAADPRYFGRTFRQRIVGKEIASRRFVLTGAGAVAGEVFARHEVVLRERTRVRSVACDGFVRLEPGCIVSYWIDAEQRLEAAPGCNLGTAASCAGPVILAPTVRFHRLWGAPVGAPVSSQAAPLSSRAESRDSDVITRADAAIAPGAVINGTVKATGSIQLGRNAHVHGHAIAGKNVRIAPGAIVEGHVFAGERIAIGAGARIGSANAVTTVYAKHIELASDATVWGWIVADRGGVVR